MREFVERKSFSEPGSKIEHRSVFSPWAGLCHLQSPGNAEQSAIGAEKVRWGEGSHQHHRKITEDGECGMDTLRSSRELTIGTESCKTWSMVAYSSSDCCLSWAGEHIYAGKEKDPW